MRAIAGDAMSGTLEASVASGVHMQQITRARPLIAADVSSWLWRSTG
jgi:hypothetical protein